MNHNPFPISPHAYDHNHSYIYASFFHRRTVSIAYRTGIPVKFHVAAANSPVITSSTADVRSLLDHLDQVTSSGGDKETKRRKQAYARDYLAKWLDSQV